jgi:murein DD-endopeptidase MepM/ murein hydrolase activator NlpD
MNRITRLVVGLSLALPLLGALPGVVAASSVTYAASAPEAMAATLPVGGAVNIPASFTIVPPWGDNVTHKIIGGYGTKLHLNTNQPLRVNDYYALDFDLALDEAVYPVAGGTVIFAGLATASGWETYGNLVYIDHGNGFKSIYAHLDNLLVATGQTVTTGTKLGGAGYSGGWPANDVHLHFALYYKSLAANAQPLPYGGVAAVPEPFSSCTKNGSGICQNLVYGDQLNRGGAAPSCGVPSGTFCAAYYNNQSLSGNPTFVQNESSINHDWGNGGPGNGVGNDHFSTRWQGSFGFNAANYTFTYSSDDGMRIWLDGSPIVDQWSDQGASTRTKSVNVSGGSHTVKVEYYENGGAASAKVSWAQAAAPSCGVPSGTFCAAYYNNQSLSGNPTFVQNESSINHDWGNGGPGNGVGNDHFSTRWQGSFGFNAANYTFTYSSDDGMRIWLDGSPIVDQWSDQGASTRTKSVNVSGGSHTVKVEYYENGGAASAKVSWAQVQQVSVPVAPSNIRATATGPTNIHVTWSDNANNETGYRITDGISTVLLGANATSFDWSVNPSTYKCFATQAYNSAGSSAWTSWGCTTTPSAGYGDVIVDDQSGGFARAGTTSYWHEYGGGYNGHFWWTYTNTNGVNNRAMWTPNLPASGNWQVFVFVPSVNATTTNARYRIDHNGSQTTVSRNQNNYYNAWVSLGTYYFPSGGGVNGEVFLGDETYEGSAHQIAFDAVKWVWVGP